MKAFFDRIRALTGPLSQAQVDGFETILAASAGLPVTHRAYLLATAWHETARTMQPVRETLAATDDKAIARLEAAFAKGKLPWVRTPYWRKDSQGRSWLGRGYVQLTHETNYRRAGRELGVDLVGNPDVAMQPTVAAQVLVRGCAEGWFTGKKLADYLPGDYIGARRVVNGTDKAAQIAAYAETFEAALVAIKAAPKPVDDSPAPVPVAKPGLWAAIIAIIASIFGSKK
jgi:predicted chitinase